MRRTYKVVDVFSNTVFRGNPVAVVLDADGLSADDMQRIAAWTNLSETTFLLPPSNPAASYRLRIFTPRSELPFAGHPTLGSAHAVLESGRATAVGGVLIQDCAIGLVNIRVDEARIAFELPPARLSPLTSDRVDELDVILGVKSVRAPMPALVDVGPRWIVAQLADAAEVVGLRPNLTRLQSLEREIGGTGLTIFGRHAAGDVTFEVRSFAPSSGINEDPVCGSGNGCVAAFLWSSGNAQGGLSYTAAQGRCVGRDGRIEVTVDAGGRITLGGACVTGIDGVLDC